MFALCLSSFGWVWQSRWSLSDCALDMSAKPPNGRSIASWLLLQFHGIFAISYFISPKKRQLNDWSLGYILWQFLRVAINTNRLLAPNNTICTLCSEARKPTNWWGCANCDVLRNTNLGDRFWHNFQAKHHYGVLPYVMTCVRRPRSSSSIVHHKVSGSNISRTFWPRVTKCYTDIHTDLLYSRTGYDVTNYTSGPKLVL